MAHLYGGGCARCNKEIAAAIADMPKMDGYLDTDAYCVRYCHLPAGTWPKPYVDGEFIAYTTAIVLGDDGWLLAQHDDGRGVHPCACDSGNIAQVLYRGKVELR